MEQQEQEQDDEVRKTPQELHAADILRLTDPGYEPSIDEGCDATQASSSASPLQVRVSIISDEPHNESSTVDAVGNLLDFDDVESNAASNTSSMVTPSALTSPFTIDQNEGHRIALLEAELKALKDLRAQWTEWMVQQGMQSSPRILDYDDFEGNAASSTPSTVTPSTLTSPSFTVNQHEGYRIALLRNRSDGVSIISDEPYNESSTEDAVLDYDDDESNAASNNPSSVTPSALTSPFTVDQHEGYRIAFSEAELKALRAMAQQGMQSSPRIGFSPEPASTNYRPFHWDMPSLQSPSSAAQRPVLRRSLSIDPPAFTGNSSSTCTIRPDPPLPHEDGATRAGCRFEPLLEEDSDDDNSSCSSSTNQHKGGERLVQDAEDSDDQSSRSSSSTESWQLSSALKRRQTTSTTREHPEESRQPLRGRLQSDPPERAVIVSAPNPDPPITESLLSVPTQQERGAPEAAGGGSAEPSPGANDTDPPASEGQKFPPKESQSTQMAPRAHVESEEERVAPSARVQPVVRFERPGAVSMPGPLATDNDDLLDDLSTVDDMYALSQLPTYVAPYAVHAELVDEDAEAALRLRVEALEVADAERRSRQEAAEAERVRRVLVESVDTAEAERIRRQRTRIRIGRPGWRKRLLSKFGRFRHGGSLVSA